MFMCTYLFIFKLKKLSLINVLESDFWKSYQIYKHFYIYYEVLFVLMIKHKKHLLLFLKIWRGISQIRIFGGYIRLYPQFIVGNFS